MYFEQGQEYPRAIQYLYQAGENATHHNAHREAIIHFSTALELLTTLSDTPKRAQQELTSTPTGNGVIGCQGLCSRSGKRLHAGPRTLSAGWRDPTTFYRLAWITTVLFCTGKAPNGARIRGGSAQVGSRCPRYNLPRSGPSKE